MKQAEGQAWAIYALSDPRVPDQIRYVGYTSLQAEERLQVHLWEASCVTSKRTHKISWLRKLTTDGVRPLVEVLQSGSGDGWEWAERNWVARLKMLGHRLLNATNGGEGNRGYVASEETKAKIGAATRDRLASPEYREKTRLVQMVHVTPEFRAKVSARSTLQFQSVEQREKASAAHKGRIASTETLAKLSASLKEVWQSEEYKQKMAKRDRWGGVSLDDRNAHAAKMREARWGKPMSKEERLRRRKARAAAAYQAKKLLRSESCSKS